MNVVYPGSFDPITLGHVDIIERISKLYENVTVLVSVSSEKNYTFTAQERKELIEKALAHLKNIKVEVNEGLTTDYAKKNKIKGIVRGLRAVADYEYELTMANINKKLNPHVETLLIFASPEFYFVSSRGVKEVAKHGGKLEGLVSENVKKALLKKMKRKK